MNASDRYKDKWTRKINRLLEEDRFQEMRQNVRMLLKEFPASGFVNNWMAISYYYENRFRLALRWNDKAYKLTPSDPSVMFFRVSILTELSKPRDAIDVCSRLLRMGPKRAGTVECTEGIIWAEEVLNDARYLMAANFLEIGEVRKSHYQLREHLKNRSRGIRSLYSKAQVKQLLER